MSMTNAWKAHAAEAKISLQLAIREKNKTRREVLATKSIVESKAALVDFPTYLPAMVYIGTALSLLDRHTEAIEAFESCRAEFARHNHRSADWAKAQWLLSTYRCAKASLALKLTEKALNLVDEGIAFENLSKPPMDKMWFYYLGGEAMIARNRPDEAIAYLFGAWQLGCRHDYVYRGLAKSFVRLGDFGRARQSLGHLEPRDRAKDANVLIAAEIELGLGNRLTAAALLDNVVERSSMMKHKLLLLRGRIAKLDGDLAKARTCFVAADEYKRLRWGSHFLDALAELQGLHSTGPRADSTAAFGVAADSMPKCGEGEINPTLRNDSEILNDR